LNSAVPKPLIEIFGKPICAYTIEAFEQSPMIDSIIIVGHHEQLAKLKRIVKRYGYQKVIKIIVGGETRRESVANGLTALDEDTEVVIIHDGVRPLVTPEIIAEAIGQCREWDAVVVAVPIKPTIKKVNSKDLCVEETLNRDELWEIQTPQVFKKDILTKAHRQNTNDNPTDDAAMVEQLGVKVKIVPGNYKNIKITTQEDLIVAESFLKGVSY